MIGPVLVAVFTAMGWLYHDANRERVRANTEAHRAKLQADLANAAAARAVNAKEAADKALVAANRAIDQQGWQQKVYLNALTGKKELQQEIQRAMQDRRAVYLQFSDPEQRRAVKALRPHLGSAGWSAPGVGARSVRTEHRADPLLPQGRRSRSPQPGRAVQALGMG